MKTNRILFLLSVLLYSLPSCKEKTDISKISDFIGNYIVGDGSYRVPLDADGNPINTEQQSIAGEIMTVSAGTADTMILTSITLGTIAVIGTPADQSVNLSMPDQPYNGYFNQTGEEATLKTTESFFFTKQPDGKKFFDSKSGKGNIMVFTRAGNKYQVGFRRTGLQ